MTRDELIEVIANALRNAQLNTFSNQAAIAITAIEAQGLAIVPVDATEAMRGAGAKGSGEDSEGVALGAWDSMIRTGRI